MRTSKQKIVFWILVAVIAALCAACSTDNKSGQGQEDATKPPPQVRVETLPTNTASPDELSTEAVASPTVAPTAAEVFVWPTPDEDTMVNDIDSLMNDIDNQLKSENITIKP